MEFLEARQRGGEVKRERRGVGWGAKRGLLVSKGKEEEEASLTPSCTYSRRSEEKEKAGRKSVSSRSGLQKISSPFRLPPFPKHGHFSPGGFWVIEGRKEEGEEEAEEAQGKGDEED